MKERIQYIIIDGPQLILACLALALITAWIIARLCMGTLSIPGFIIAALIWRIVFGLTRLAIRDYKRDINQPSSK